MLVINKHFNFAVLELWLIQLSCVQFFDVIFAVLIKFVGRKGMKNLETWTIARTGEF